MLWILFAALFGTSAATLGFDTIQNLTVNEFLCLKDYNYSFYVARIWQSLGKFDEHGMQNMRNAHEAGFNVSAYIFPCLAKKCASPQEQVETTINRLKSYNVHYERIFLDIEIFDWPNDIKANRKFINAMCNKLDEMGVKWGIYTNENNWNKIVGKKFNKWKHKKLWWAYWGANNGTLKSNFKSFGGWKDFYMQQYAGDFKGPCRYDHKHNLSRARITLDRVNVKNFTKERYRVALTFSKGMYIIKVLSGN
ncbi:unnamed protein product [Cylicocyclus nassatus]|uniref:Lysozyme n=1 Tax=Cylicocyclus nassatus TaxID=53992 RepID=A0AA36DRD6_CYLNA|nr:unnamed protein product [Cylicocyclus nassatus]